MEVRRPNTPRRVAYIHPFSTIQLLNCIVYRRLEYSPAAEGLYDLSVPEELGENTS